MGVGRSSPGAERPDNRHSQGGGLGPQTDPPEARPPQAGTEGNPPPSSGVVLQKRASNPRRRCPRRRRLRRRRCRRRRDRGRARPLCTGGHAHHVCPGGWRRPGQSAAAPGEAHRRGRAWGSRVCQSDCSAGLRPLAWHNLHPLPVPCQNGASDPHTAPIAFPPLDLPPFVPCICSRGTPSAQPPARAVGEPPRGRAGVVLPGGGAGGRPPPRAPVPGAAVGHRLPPGAAVWGGRRGVFLASPPRRSSALRRCGRLSGGLPWTALAPSWRKEPRLEVKDISLTGGLAIRGGRVTPPGRGGVSSNFR